MAAPKEGDLRAGLTGLIIGAVVLLAVLTAIVHFTNARYAGETPAAATK
ncbi:MAG: hypothetical protein JJD97_06615 [Gemmatimonadaceae bacterium]|nr:hypothetical protein [Gemmatimonadaceae bacterium]